MRFPKRAFWRAVVSAGLFVALTAFVSGQAAAAQFPMTKGQQKCAAAMSKNAQKLQGSVGKDYKSCFKNESKGKLLTSVGFCVTQDLKGKRAKGVAKLISDSTKNCDLNGKEGITNNPPFGPSPDAAAAADAATDIHTLLWQDLLGDPNDWLLVNGKADPNDIPNAKETSKCQQTIIKDVLKCVDTTLKEFTGCLKGGLKGGKVTVTHVVPGLSVPADQGPFDDTGDLNACAAADIKGKILKACTTKLNADIGKKCVSPADTDLAVPGCAGAGDLGTCLRSNIDCRVCQGLNRYARTSTYCDTCAVDPNDHIPTVTGILDRTVVCIDPDPNAYPREIEVLGEIPDPNDTGSAPCVIVTTGGGCPGEPPMFGITDETCRLRSHSDIAFLDTTDPNKVKRSAIGVPLMGNFEVDCGQISGGIAPCSSVPQPLRTINLGLAVGWVCFDPAPETPCIPGFSDCDGGTPMDLDTFSEHDIDICFSKAECEGQCDAYCVDLNGGDFFYQRSSGNCGGYCTDPNLPHTDPGGSCITHADCTRTNPALPFGSCAGPTGGEFSNPHANECQCICTGIGGNPSRQGAATYSNSTILSLEGGGEFGGQICFEQGGELADVTSTGTAACTRFTTEQSTGILLNANRVGPGPFPTIVGPTMNGRPGGCPFGGDARVVTQGPIFDQSLGDFYTTVQSGRQ